MYHVEKMMSLKDLAKSLKREEGMWWERMDGMESSSVSTTCCCSLAERSDARLLCTRSELERAAEEGEHRRQS